MNLVGWILNPKPLYCGKVFTWTASDVFVSYCDALLGICVRRMFVRSKFSSVHGVSIRLHYCSSPLRKTTYQLSITIIWYQCAEDHYRMPTLQSCIKIPSSWMRFLVKLNIEQSLSSKLNVAILDKDHICCNRFGKQFGSNYIIVVIEDLKSSSRKTLQASEWQSSPAPINVYFVSKSYWTTPANWAALNECTQN